MGFHCILCISTVLLLHIFRIYVYFGISFQLLFLFLMRYPKIHIK